jgi:acyl-CoA thioester hydrolase
MTPKSATKAQNTAPNPPLFAWPLRVYYEDTDLSGVVYHASYLRFLERARTEWLRSLGFSQERLKNELGVVFTVAGMEIDFRRPARLDDALEATVELQGSKRASLNFVQTLRRAGDVASVLTQARVRVACVAMGSFKPCALPGEIFAAAEASCRRTEQVDDKSEMAE